MSTFQLQDGSKVTYVDYYRDKYKLQIRDKKQPMLVSQDKRNPDMKYYLVPELVRIVREL